MLTLNSKGRDFSLGAGRLSGRDCWVQISTTSLRLFSSLSPVLPSISSAPSQIFLYSLFVFLLTPRISTQNSHFHGWPVFSMLSGWPAVLMAVSSISQEGGDREGHGVRAWPEDLSNSLVLSSSILTCLHAHLHSFIPLLFSMEKQQGGSLANLFASFS